MAATRTQHPRFSAENGLSGSEWELWPCQRLPTGTTSRPKVALVTRAKLPYMASAPQTRPTQPPRVCSIGLPITAPPPKRKKASHRVRKIPNNRRDKRKVEIQSPRVNTPHRSRHTPMDVPAPDRSRM